MTKSLMKQLKDRMKPEEHEHTAKITFDIDLDSGMIISHEPSQLVFDGLSVAQNMRRACAINALYDAHYDFEKMYKTFISAGFEDEDIRKPARDYQDLLYDMLNAYSDGQDLEPIVDNYYDEQEREE